MERVLCPVLIGRDAELSLLEDALVAAHRGDGQAVLIAGDAGVGKTRLVSELQLRARRAGILVLSGSTSEAEMSLPYLPFVEAIGNYLAGMELEPIRNELGPATCRQLSQILPQFELQTTLIDPGEPNQAKVRLYEAMLSLLRALAARQGMLLVLEDLHWADASSRELLEYIVRRIRRRTRLMVLATYRSDEISRRHPLLPLVQGWERSGAMPVIHLAPLAAAGVEAMVSAIFDAAPVAPELRDFLFMRTEGNPFVLEEFLKAALDRGDIFLTDGGWDRKAIHDLRLPSTVKQAILVRVERMSDELAAILRAAAVLGRSFDYRLLVAVAAQPEPTVLHALRAFVNSQLMDEEPNGHYRFRHALTREAIYDDLIAPERERLHAAAAKALESWPSADKHELAFHLMAAGKWDAAIPVALDAAREAEADRAYTDAAHIYERVVDRVTDRCQRADVLSAMGRAYFFGGEPRRGQRYLDEGIAALESCGKTREAASFGLWLGRCYWLQARPDLAVREYEKARATLEPFGPSADLAIAYVRLGAMAGFDKDHERAFELCHKAVTIAEAAGADAARIFAYGYVGDNLAAMGKIEEGLAWLDRSYLEAIERGFDWMAETAMYNSIGDYVHFGRIRQAKERLAHYQARSDPSRAREPTYLQQLAELAMRADGEPERARALLEAALPQLEDAGEALFAARMRLDLAYVYTTLDRLDDARRNILPEPASPEQGEVMFLLYIRFALNLAAGDLRALREDAERVRDFLRENPKKWSEVYMLDRVTQAFIRVGDPASARQVVESAITDRFPDHPLLWRIEGRVLLAEGRVAAALPLLERAAKTLQEAGYMDEAWPSRRAYAEALARAGQRAQAEAELRGVLEEATSRLHHLEARLAREALRDLGVQISEPAAGRAEAQVPPGIRQPTERLVTVLFMDVRDYTALTLRQAPDQLADQIASLYRWAENEIRRHHGLVGRYEGDAIMATFNVTGVRLDHPVQALQAALAIREKAAFAGLPVGIGIAVGPAIVGQFSQGSPVTAVGETINLAARLQSEVHGGEVLMSEETFRRTSGWLQSEEFLVNEEWLTLKGFPQPVRAYRLAAATRSGSTKAS